jgi:hypothetical protein
MGGLRVQISEDGADAERLDALSRYLRSELLELDVENVTALPGGESPPGARVFETAVAGGLLVTIGEAADSFRAVILTIRTWLQRGEGTGRKVRVEIDGDALELSDASPAEQDRLIELFASRHAPGQAAGQAGS